MTMPCERPTERLVRNPVSARGGALRRTIAWIVGGELGIPEGNALVILLLAPTDRETLHALRRWLLCNLAQARWGVVFDVSDARELDPNSSLLLRDAIAYARAMGRRVAVVGATASLNWCLRHDHALDVACLRTWEDFKRAMASARATRRYESGRPRLSDVEPARGESARA